MCVSPLASMLVEACWSYLIDFGMLLVHQVQCFINTFFGASFFRGRVVNTDTVTMSQCPFLFFLPDAFPIPLLLTSYSFPVRSLFNFHSFLFVSYSRFIHVLFISFSFSFVSFSFLYSLRNLPKCAKARIFFFYQSLI